ncbi:MAG: hypothetical protein IKI41_04275 [Clostridia bacterium]|nr:hypothetical protein [Clostridia bacterium]
MTLFDTFCGKQGKLWEDLPLSGDNRPALQPGATFWLKMSRVKKYRARKKTEKNARLGK